MIKSNERIRKVPDFNSIINYFLQKAFAAISMLSDIVVIYYCKFKIILKNDMPNRIIWKINDIEFINKSTIIYYSKVD